MNLVTLTPYYKVIADAQSRALDETCYVMRGCAPTANGTGLRVDVSAGDSVEGGTPHYNYAGGNVTLSAAPATPKYRRDIVYRDSTGTLTVGTGTAALLTSTTPVPPVLPANATLLAVCFVAYGQTTLAATDVEDCRQVRRDAGDGMNALIYGAVPDSVTDNSAFIQAAVNALPSTGGTVVIPGSSGYYAFATTIDCSGKYGIRFVGSGGPSGGAGTASRLVYTGTGANAFNCQSSSGVSFHNLYIESNSASFSGKVIDYRGLGASDSAYGLIDNCIIVQNASSTGEGVALNKAIFITVRDSYVYRGKYGISGADVGGYSNSIKLDGVRFALQTDAAIRDMGQGWKVSACGFEPLSGGGVVAHVPLIGAANGVEWTGNWIGDQGTSTTTQLTLSGYGFDVRGNYFAGGVNSTAIRIVGNSFGVDISGNDFESHSIAVLVDGGNGVSNFNLGPNRYTSVSTVLSGTPTSGSAMDTNGLLHLYGQGAQAAGSAAGALEVKIAETLLSQTTATVTFSSIPQGFRHLRLVLNTRSDTAAANADLMTIQLNGSGSAIYYTQRIRGSAAVVSAAETLAATSGSIGICPQNSTTAGLMGTQEVIISDYASARIHNWISRSFGMIGTASGNLFVEHYHGFWNSGAAITSLTVLVPGASFVSGSLFTLYGVP